MLAANSFTSRVCHDFWKVGIAQNFKIEELKFDGGEQVHLVIENLHSVSKYLP